MTWGRPDEIRVIQPSLSSSNGAGSGANPTSMPAAAKAAAPPRASGVGSGMPIDHSANTGSDERSHARRGAALMRARLEGHVDVSTARGCAGIRESQHLGVRLAGARVEALAHDRAVGDDHAADEGIGRGTTSAALG